MKITKTAFSDLFVIEPTVIEDHRGYFMESYNHKKLREHGIDFKFVQDNHSLSKYGVIRGLHFQNPPHSQTKLIRAVFGNILDVVVDLRKSYSTYGKHYAIELSSENKKQLLVPKGFAHGFAVLSEEAEILYKCDGYYHKQSEGGLRFDDDAFQIDWGLPKKDLVLSEKDLNHQKFNDFISEFN